MKKRERYYSDLETVVIVISTFYFIIGFLIWIPFLYRMFFLVPMFIIALQHIDIRFGYLYYITIIMPSYYLFNKLSEIISRSAYIFTDSLGYLLFYGFLIVLYILSIIKMHRHLSKKKKK